MNKPYIAIIGTYDEYTTEQVVLKETMVQAKNELEAHKIAFYKCNIRENHIVLKILDYNNKRVLFDHFKGFMTKEME